MPGKKGKDGRLKKVRVFRPLFEALQAILNHGPRIETFSDAHGHRVLIEFPKRHLQGQRPRKGRKK